MDLKKCKITMTDIVVLFDGYSKASDSNMIANCSCTLIKGFHNIIIDTMTSWDSVKLLNALKENEVEPHNIQFVISTHGHSDHIGNNNLFLNAKHIVGFSISYKDTYFPHEFDKGEEFIIEPSVKVIPTPGHTLSDVTVIVRNREMETVAIAGDLFEKLEDIEDPSIWQDAGSENRVIQMVNRAKVADLADWIIPGHGPKFKVTNQIRETLKSQIQENEK